MASTESISLRMAPTSGGKVMDLLFPNNESALDRILRIVLGIGLLSLYVLGPKTAWGLIGLIPLATSLIGSCPIYTMIGVSTVAAGHKK